MPFPKRIAAGLLGLLWGMASPAALTAELDHTPLPRPTPVQSRFLVLDTYSLWPEQAPQATGTGPDEAASLSYFPPPRGTGNGTAVIVAPGGGYLGLSADLEGRLVADWFASRGISAFVLKYRVGRKARLPIPLLDGQRAVRFVRAHAERFRIDPARIGMIGFSAGGHLAAMTAADADDGRSDARDPIERTGSRLNFLVLGYPWLEATVVRPDGTSQYCMFAGRDCDPSAFASYQPIPRVRGDFPPTFIYHTSNDEVVPVTGAIRLYDTLIAQQVPAELHAFAAGPHGSGLGGTDPALNRWPELLEQWLASMKLLKRR